MIIAKKEKKLILDYIYRDCLRYQKSKLFLINRVKARWLSQLFYENLSQGGKLKIYREVLKRKIIKYLIEGLLDSLTFSEVNGTPEQRRSHISEHAHHMYNGMSKMQKVFICEKLGFVYL